MKSEYTMTTKQAGSLLGLTAVTIQQAIISGHLAAEKRKVPTSVGNRWTYFVNPDDLPRYVAYRERRNPQTAWTLDMDAALVELLPTCTRSQVAAYLGVNLQSVKYRIRKLGIKVGHRPTSPFQIPISGLLLAKTCLGCGELLDARCFHTSGKRKHGAAQCMSCTPRMEWRKGRKNKDAEIKRALNDHARQSAHRHRDEWTEADDSYLAASLNKSDYRIALDLGRTIHSVCHRRHKLGLAKAVNPIDRRAGAWGINFPATQQEIEAYFRGLSRAVPEEMWDWDDKQTA